MTEYLAITGGHVVPVSGDPIPGGTVVIVDGVITAVGGADTVVPEGARGVDASGRWVLPGFTSVSTRTARAGPATTRTR